MSPPMLPKPELLEWFMSSDELLRAETEAATPEWVTAIMPSVKVTAIWMAKSNRAQLRPVENIGDDAPIQKVRKEALDYLSQTLLSAEKGKPFSLEGAEVFLTQCISTPKMLEKLFVFATNGNGNSPSNSLAVHLFNHTVLTLKLGRELQWKDKQLIRLGVASMLHDIGMCRVPKHIRHKKDPLSPGEIADLQKHPEHGFNIIQEQFQGRSNWLADAIYHEHEREDGRGYPQGLSSGQISDYAKVIGFVDVYEALTHNRPYRKRYIPSNAIYEITKTQKNAFHTTILEKAFEEFVEPFRS